MAATFGEQKHGTLVRTLRRCLLFSGSPTALLERVVAITVTKNLRAGEYLFHEGSPVHGIYVVLQGAIKVHRVNPLGREQVIHVFRPFESFAEESLVSLGGHPACASATEASAVLLVRKAEFLALMRRQPELALGVLRSLNHHVQILVSLLDDLTLKDVKTRLANWLLERCPDPASRKPVCIRLPSTKRVLAAELGTVSETLSRTVAKLRDQKLLSVQGDTVTLLCPHRLTRLFRPAVFPVDISPLDAWSARPSEPASKAAGRAAGNTLQPQRTGGISISPI